MREQHDSDGPGTPKSEAPADMSAWKQVSDPFERPKVYRHKTPLIQSSGDGKGVHLFIIVGSGIPPLALHDMGDNLQAPELRFLIDDEPLEIGVVERIPRQNADGYLSLSGMGTKWTLHLHGMKNLGKVAQTTGPIPFRLKTPDAPTKTSSEQASNPSRGPNYSLFVTPTQPPTLRGVIEGPALAALHQAIELTQAR